ncbi:MAG TPA: DUF2191 domain-containing protein [Thermoanaerobaculia bacterium]|nr:DUF2191 domain-containing protein [Thermoanaerobaculia bacterium]
MRTTLTLDDDLARLLKKAARDQERPFKQVVNEAIRKGLMALERPPVREPYRLEPSDLGEVRPGIDLTKALALADELEDEALRQKLEQRK